MKQLLTQSRQNFIVHFMFAVIDLPLCRHLDHHSVRFFKKSTFSNRVIATFSGRHKSHFREPHLYGIGFVFIRHFRQNSVLLSFSDKKVFDNPKPCL